MTRRVKSKVEDALALIPVILLWLVVAVMVLIPVAVFVLSGLWLVRFMWDAL